MRDKAVSSDRRRSISLMRFRMRFTASAEAVCSRLSLGSWAFAAFTFFILLFFLKPNAPETLEYFGLNSPVSLVTWQVLLVALSCGLMAFYFRVVGLDLFGGLVLALFVIIALATISNRGDMTSWVFDSFPCMALALFVGASWKTGRVEQLLKGAMLASTFYLIANLVLLLLGGQLFSADPVTDLFYGYRNITFRVAIPAFSCSLVLDSMHRDGPSVRSWLIFAVSLAEMLIAYSATSVCGMAVMGVLVFSSRFGRLRRFFNGLTGLCFYAAAFLGIVVFRVQDYAAPVIENVLGRSVTLTGRTFIWDEVFQLLDGIHLVKGYGQSYIWNALVVNNEAFMHAHNEFLHVFMLGGVVGAAVFVTILVLVAWHLFRYRASFGAACLSATLFAYLVIGLAETTLFPSSFFLLAVMYYYCRYRCCIKESRSTVPFVCYKTERRRHRGRHARTCFASRPRIMISTARCLSTAPGLKCSV